MKPDEFKSTLNFPVESTADVTFRRLQQFQVPAGKHCAWELTRDGVAVAKGSIQPSPTGLLTIPCLTISQIPSLLNLKIKP